MQKLTPHAVKNKQNSLHLAGFSIINILGHALCTRSEILKKN
jgi:hypothetical protein